MKSIILIGLLASSVSFACNPPTLNGNNQEVFMNKCSMTSLNVSPTGEIHMLSTYEPNGDLTCPGGLFQFDPSTGCWNKLDK